MEQICFFNTAKAWGGGEKWHFEVSSYLYEQGYNVFVFAHEKSVLLQKLKAAKIPCKGIKISNLSFLNPFAYAKIKRLFKTKGFHIIIMNLSRDLKIAGPIAKKVGINRIIYRRGSAIPIKNTFLNRYYFKSILTEVLANSEATKKTVLKNNTQLIPKDKITVIYNGIRIIKNSLKKEETGLFTIVNLGRLEYQKNQKFLIHLAQKLKSKNVAFKMLIGGQGRLKNELEELIIKLNVENNVKLVGFIEDPIKFISSCDVFILPSFWEGFGYVLAEAALCKKPIIAFDVSSNPELVINGKTGFLIPENNMEEFADKVIQLNNDENKRLEMGINGYTHIISNFDKNKQLKKIEAYLING